MVSYIRANGRAALFIGIVALTLIRVVAAFYSGLSGCPYDVISLLSTEPIRYILLVLAAIVVLSREVSRSRKIFALSAMALLFLIGLIPTGHYLTLGALLSMRNANAEPLRDEARRLLAEYGADTKFSDTPPRVLYQYEQFPRSDIPPSISRASIGDVFLLENYVLIEKFGLGGSFRGFIVFREGFDPWSEGQAIALLDGCSYCWRIRIIDGLYWYHAAPVDEGDARLDFLSE
jgi:hypothetical protein